MLPTCFVVSVQIRFLPFVQAPLLTRTSHASLLRPTHSTRTTRLEPLAHSSTSIVFSSTNPFFAFSPHQLYSPISHAPTLPAPPCPQFRPPPQPLFQIPFSPPLQVPHSPHIFLTLQDLTEHNRRERQLANTRHICCGRPEHHTSQEHYASNNEKEFDSDGNLFDVVG
jgi:hypothetical protein